LVDRSPMIGLVRLARGLTYLILVGAMIVRATRIMIAVQQSRS